MITFLFINAREHPVSMLGLKTAITQTKTEILHEIYG
jgi:hypothetical protein